MTCSIAGIIAKAVHSFQLAFGGQKQGGVQQEYLCNVGGRISFQLLIFIGL